MLSKSYLLTSAACIFARVKGRFLRWNTLGKWVVMGVALAACNARQYVLRTEYSFDGPAPLPGWTAFGARSQDHPRSPPNCTWVGVGRQVSDGYSAPVGDAQGAVPRKVRVRAWVWFTTVNERFVSIALKVECHGHRPDVWQVKPLINVVSRVGTWELVDFTYRLPSDLRPDDHLSVYLWQPNEAASDPVYLDDMQLDAWRYSD